MATDSPIRLAYRDLVTEIVRLYARQLIEVAVTYQVAIIEWRMRHLVNNPFRPRYR